MSASPLPSPVSDDTPREAIAAGGQAMSRAAGGRAVSRLRVHAAAVLLWAALGLILGPVFLAGTWTGQRLFPLAPPVLFRRLAFVLIVAAATSGLPLWD